MRSDESWKLAARCRDEDPVLWFPRDDDERHYDSQVRAYTMTAKAICGQCPVRAQCLRYAIDVDERYGIWGGMTERERMRITGKRP